MYLRYLPLELVLLGFASLPVCAQQAPPAIAPASTTVVVLGNSAPVSQGESARTVVALDTQQHALAYRDVEDYLRTDASVDIQQRGAAGVMADISIRGASFEQTLVMVNGLRINNAETSHFNLDLPLPLAALGSIDILHGAGSTLYGSDAIGGVVDYLTWKPDANTLRLRTGAGSDGENEQVLLGSIAARNWSEVIAGSRGFSTGFIPDRDYRTEDASTETRLATRLGSTDLLFSGDDRAFGAAQFYGNYNSWERTKGWFASVAQQFNAHTEAAAGYRRHSDLFLLRRNQPAGYKNQHVDDGFQGSLRDRREILRNTTLLCGLEEITDQIESTNLGRHGRNRGAGYGEVEWRIPQRGSIAAGLREELFSGGRSVLSPMFAGTLWLPHAVKLRASASHGFRLPTYLDLYYKDPATLGNPALQPESAWNYEGGADWYPDSRIATMLTVFDSEERDTIDYVRAASTAPWQAKNLAKLRFTGVEAAMDWHANQSQTVKLSWTWMTAAENPLRGLQSKYVFRYPGNNGRVEWNWNLKQTLLLQSRFGVVQRYHQDPDPIWDASIARETGHLRPYLQMTNLTNTGYEEIAGVRMPGRSFIGGIEFVIAKKK
ncbi:MAG TPA: TonB-dependent receptor [Acidisarcina sp.]|nr:TonB-dependent receptor [Acidisarcina sp.]